MAFCSNCGTQLDDSAESEICKLHVGRKTLQ